MITIEEWVPPKDLEGLAEVLHAAVHGGASVSFILPFSIDDARDFWTRTVAPGVLAGHRRVLLARQSERVVGTAQLLIHTPPNQAHRADVAKLLVHPDARRQGIARALMEAIERIAREEGRTLLTLDTRTGDSAERLYQEMGYIPIGVVPGHARGPLSPTLEATTFFYKRLD